MALPLTGTFTEAQHADLESFLAARLEEVALRIEWLEKRIAMVGVMVPTLDASGAIASVTGQPPNSLLARLVVAYQRLGGKTADLYVRQMTEPLVPSGEGTGSAGSVSARTVLHTDGTELPVDPPDDADVAVAIDAARKWALGAIRSRREDVEARVRKATDLADRLCSELTLLQGVSDSADPTKSLAALLAKVQGYVQDVGHPTAGGDVEGVA